MSSSPRIRPRRVWLYVVEATTVLGVLISLGTWLWPRSPAPAPVPATQPGSVTTTTAGTATTGPVGPVAAGTTPAGGVPLDSIPPDNGAGNLGPLPKDVDSADPAYAHALTIHCATNQTVDLSRSVWYQLDGRWTHLHLTIHAYSPAPDESEMQVEVFLDDTRTAVQNVTDGRSADLDAALDGAMKMELRVTCRSPHDSAILTGATLQHA